MPRLGELLRRILPNGSSDRSSRGWKECPYWPPDLFAVTAMIASISGTYADARYSATSDDWAHSPRGIPSIRTAGRKWRNTLRVPAGVGQRWRRLIRNFDCELSDRENLPHDFKDAVMFLLSVSDEASAEMGFLPKANPLASVVFEQFRLAMKANRDEEIPLKFLPNSICRLVPSSQVCVQPKTMTAQTGCTLRCFSHNLALLPGVGEVATSWFPLSTHPKTRDEHFNLLLMPFPYSVAGNVFRADEGVVPLQTLPSDTRVPQIGYYEVQQKWLTDAGSLTTQTNQMHGFLRDLFALARKEVDNVHGLVLPELALSKNLADALAKRLAREKDLELFISGGARPSTRRSGTKRNGYPENVAFVYSFDAHGEGPNWVQGKHHRWTLDSRQIAQYHLGYSLDPNSETRWWEKIDVEHRRVSFNCFRDGSSLSVLICEDLARIDPVQTVLRSVGPNLVIALLMDGPQLKVRWPSRYATVLADDPGSAVLTVTSLGMVKRSNPVGAPERREVAMWKDAGGEARELILPPKAHGLILTLSSECKTQLTVDGRTDGGVTSHFSISAIRPLTLPPERVPKWLVAE